MKKRVIALLMASLMIFALAACAQSGTTKTTPSDTAQTTDDVQADDTVSEDVTQSTDIVDEEQPETVSTNSSEVYVSLASSPETIDPNMNSSTDGATYIVHMFEGLLRYKWDGTGIELGMAKDYTVSDDGLVWTFNLRDDVYWSDGQPVTANDFVFSWKRLVDPETAAPYALDMGIYIKNAEKINAEENALSIDELGVKAIDDKTFEVTLEGPCPYFDEIAAFPTFYPIRQDTVEANGDRWTRDSSTYLTNGPFKLESFNLDQNLVIVPDENYYQKDRVVPSKIVFQFLADEVAMHSAFQAGEVSFIRNIPEEEKNALKEAGTYNLSPLIGTYYLSFNTQDDLISDVNVRKALALAVDSVYIAEVVRQGSVLPAEAFVGDGFLDVDGKQFRDIGENYMRPADYEARKEEARQALADAGYPGGEGFPKIEYMYNEGTGHKVIAEALQNMWKEVLNVDTELVSQEWNVFLDTRRKGGFQIARNGWIADFNDPMSLLTIFITGGGNNDCQYSNPAYDEQVAIATSTTDRAVRMEAMHKAEDIMLGQDWACVPIYYYAEESAISPSLKGMAQMPLGYTFFHTAYVE